MKKIITLCFALILALSLFGCQPGETPQSNPDAEVQAEKITLHVWDTFTEEGQSAGMDKMIAKFQETHPNVEFQRDAQSIDNLRPVVQTALGAENGPDIIYYDTGPGYAGVL